MITKATTFTELAAIVSDVLEREVDLQRMFCSGYGWVGGVCLGRDNRARAEYYVLEAQHAEQWTEDDAAVAR